MVDSTEPLDWRSVKVIGAHHTTSPLYECSHKSKHQTNPAEQVLLAQIQSARHTHCHSTDPISSAKSQFPAL